MSLHHPHHVWPASPGILFAEDFDDAGHASQSSADTTVAEPVEPVFSTADLDDARREGFVQGRQAVLDDIAAQQRVAASAALGQIGHLLHQAREDAATAIERSSDAIGRLMFETLAAMLPSLSARHEPAEIAGLVHDLMIGMTPETAICVSVAPDVADPVRAALGELPPDLARRVAIEPREGMAVGDSRLTWGSGSAVRNGRRTLQAINEILERLDLLPPTPPPAKPRAAFVPNATTQPAFEEGERLDA